MYYETLCNIVLYTEYRMWSYQYGQSSQKEEIEWLLKRRTSHKTWLLHYEKAVTESNEKQAGDLNWAGLDAAEWFNCEMKQGPDYMMQ